MRNTVITFFILIPLMSVCLLILPKKDFSENENRYLAKFPEFSVESMLQGNFTDGINTWLTDHFPARDFFVGIKTQSDLLLGKKIINQIYVINSDLLIEEYQEPQNTDKISKILDKFNQKISEAFPTINMQIMLVPTAVKIYEEYLPSFAPKLDQVENTSTLIQKSKIPSIDVYNILRIHKDEEYLYYRTDHHWTTKAAYYAYQEYCNQNNLKPIALDCFISKQVTDDFYGTLFSKVKNYQMNGDVITIYEYPEWDLSVYYEDADVETDSLYNLEYLNQKDKYSLFLNNLHSLIEITNKNVHNGHELVLIKDSYANSMVPFLVNHFEKIYVFDTRSYKKGISQFLSEQEGITDILILYNMNSIDTDTGIYGIY